MNRLAGSTALVTGAARGLGAQIAKRFAEEGARVFVNDLRLEAAQATAEAVGGVGIACDVSDSQAVKAMFAEVGKTTQRLDILVNNAGIIRRAPAIAFSEQDWDDVLQVNLKAVFFLSQAAARVMAEQGGGKIIHIASMLSYHGGILVPAYTAAKSALAGVTRAQANEWAAKGINVNAIAPGYMATDNTAPLRADPVRNPAIVARIPAGRWGDPGDLKGIVAFLASDAAAYMQGAVIPVDGGWLAR